MADTRQELELQRPLVAFDLETTGLNIQEDRIVEICCVKLFPDGRREIKTRRLNPTRPIAPAATEVHGIRDEDVAAEPTFQQIGSGLNDFLRDCDLTGFNMTAFDLPILSREFKRIGISFPGVDTRIVDSRKIFVAKEPRTLEAAFSLYCGKALDHAHSAEADAVAAAEVLLAQVERYDDLPTDLAGLDAFCHPEREHWVDPTGKLVWSDDDIIFGFGKYRGRRLRDLASEDRGYLEWIASADFGSEVVTVVGEALAGKFRRP